jgi:hypothetical protein
MRTAKSYVSLQTTASDSGPNSARACTPTLCLRRIQGPSGAPGRRSARLSTFIQQRKEEAETKLSEAARMLDLYEPVFRHKLSADRSQMSGTFER